MKKTITLCDMCGNRITDDPRRSRNTGTFYRESWDGEFFELCGPCADKVQKFIHGRKTMATEIEPLVIPFDPLWVTTSKREYRDAVRRMGEEPGDPEGKDGLTTCVPGKGCVIWISHKVKTPDLYALAAHEAVHAACDMLGGIGEEEPGSEELAYMVQTITAGIIIACEGRSDG